MVQKQNPTTFISLSFLHLKWFLCESSVVKCVRTTSVAIITIGFTFFSQASDTLAQAVSPPIPPGSLQPRRPVLPAPPQSLPNQLPSPPILTNPQPTPPTQPGASIGGVIEVKKIEIYGSTVFSPSQLQAQVAKFIGKKWSYESLFAIRAAITNFYISKGYVTSGAYLPAQDLSSGIIRVQVIEGGLERIEIRGLKHLRESYVRSRLQRVAATPLNSQHLEQALQLLQSSGLFKRVQAELKAGSVPNRSVLVVQLREAPYIHGGVFFDNNESPSIGSNRVGPQLDIEDLLGFGDRFNGYYGTTTGLNTYELNYSFPINARNGTFNVNYSNFSSLIIEAPFQNLGIRSKERDFSFGFRQPLIQTPSQEFTLGLALNLRRERTFILNNIPFSFSPGPQNGLAKETVLRFSQDWVNRGSNRVLAARSIFNFGIGALGSTINKSVPDSRFFSWIGQFQYAQSLGNGIISIARIGTQLTPYSLLPEEQFGIGGLDTVRGYRVNQRVGDNGVIGSLEVRLPLINKPNNFGQLQIAPFFDFGDVWNNSQNGGIPSPSFLASIGVGLRYQLNDSVDAQIYWGHQINAVKNLTHSSQDDGVYFSVVFHPF